ncbi:unnamed protein product, partial [Gulo gulo]
LHDYPIIRWLREKLNRGGLGELIGNTFKDPTKSGTIHKSGTIASSSILFGTKSSIFASGSGETITEMYTYGPSIPSKCSTATRRVNQKRYREHSSYTEFHYGLNVDGMEDIQLLDIKK